MTTSSNNRPLYAEYINPTNEQYSVGKENPLLLMAQACHNIDKEFNSLSSQSCLLSSKARKSNSSIERKKALKRNSVSPATKKTFIPPSSSMMFNEHLNKTFSSSSFDFSFLPNSLFHYSPFSPTFPRTSYLMDSIFSSPFVCNWIDSIHSNRLCGKHFNNHFHLLEHLCTEHSSIQSSYLSSYLPISMEKISNN